jgi:cytochrome c oxidase cbb3-type subunit 3
MNARRAAAVLAGLSVLALSLACQRMPGQPMPGDEEIPSEQVMDFDTLYAQNCAGCHGHEGRGGAAPPLNEPLYLALADFETVKTIVANGIPGTSMSAFSRRVGGPLTDEQIAALSRQLHDKWAKPAEFQGVALPPLDLPADAPKGDPTRGAAAYQTFCASCHGADGTGGPKGRSVVDHAYLGLASDYGLRTIVVVGRRDLGMPDFRDYVPGRAMTAEEITDVVAWLRAQRQ